MMHNVTSIKVVVTSEILDCSEFVIVRKLSVCVILSNGSEEEGSTFGNVRTTAPLKSKIRREMLILISATHFIGNGGNLIGSCDRKRTNNVHLTSTS